MQQVPSVNHKNLDEVSFIRPILIILLVLYHAFAPWCGTWRSFDGLEPNVIYWWLGKCTYSFMLPMFVFISGYVWAYQRETLGMKESLLKLSHKKLKRLLVPSIIFGSVYVLIIDNNVITDGTSWIKIAFDILQGYAHMWFLPMLLWCFIFSWMILRIRKAYVRWIVISGIFVASIKPLPFQVYESFYYLIYFMMGYELYLNREAFKKNVSIISIVYSWILFIISFVALNLTIEQLKVNTEYLHGLVKAASLIGIKMMTLIYASIGLFALFITSIYYTTRAELSKRIVQIGTLCFGVYLFQQFILQILYYHTSLPNYVCNNILPWIGFIITLLIAVILTYLFRLTKLGRQII